MTSSSDDRPTQRQISELSLDQLIMLQEADTPPVADRGSGDGGGGDNDDRGGGDDDGIVLPWWMRPINTIALIITVALIAGSVSSMVK